MGDKVRLIDSGEETARTALNLLKDSNLLRDDKASEKAQHRFFVSDVPEKFSQVATRFLGQQVDRITRVDLTSY